MWRPSTTQNPRYTEQRIITWNTNTSIITFLVKGQTLFFGLWLERWMVRWRGKQNKTGLLNNGAGVQVGDLCASSCPPVICLQTYPETCCHLPTLTSIHPIHPWNPRWRTKDPLPILLSSSLLLSSFITYTHLHSFVKLQKHTLPWYQSHHSWMEIWNFWEVTWDSAEIGKQQPKKSTPINKFETSCLHQEPLQIS